MTIILCVMPRHYVRFSQNGLKSEDWKALVFGQLKGMKIIGTSIIKTIKLLQFLFVI